MKNLKIKKIAAVIMAALTVAAGFAAPQTALAEPIQMQGATNMRDAQQVSIGQDVDVKLTYNNDKQHFFSFTTTDRDSTYTFWIEYIDGNARHDCHLQLLDANSDQKAYVGLGAYDTRRSTENVYLNSNTTYYINIKSDCSNFAEGQTETLSFRVIENITPPARLVITNAKPSGKKAVKVSWSRNNKASKYEIQYRIQGEGDWRKPKTSKKTSIKISKLKRNMTYEFQVRGVRTLNGKSYKGEWSESAYATTK